MKPQEPAQSENLVVTSKETLNFRDKLRRFFSNYGLIRIFFAVALLIFISLAVIFRTVERPSEESLRLFKYSLSVNYLEIVSVSPNGVVSPNTDITINFNLPIIAHHAEEFIAVSPMVAGSLVQGANDKQIVFKPSEPFPRGALVRITLKEGMPSETGKKLIQDYSFSFSINNDPGTISFTKDYLTAKFMSFSKELGAEVNLRIGSYVEKPKIKVFRVNPNLLLESLVYQLDPRYSSSSIYSGVYLEKPIDTKDLELVQEYENIIDGYKLKFKNKEGIYLFQALEGDNVISNLWVTLNGIGIHFRQDDQKVFLASQDIVSGEPVEAIDVKFYKLEDSPTLIDHYTHSGIQEYSLAYPNKIDLIIATKNDDVMVIPVNVPNSQAEIGVYKNLNESYQIFLYTDRPIYKKGDEVSFRGIVRKDNDAIYSDESLVKNVRVYMYDYAQGQNKKLIDQTVIVRNGGIFYGEFNLPDDIQSGTHYLYATSNLSDVDNFNSTGSTYFDIFEYNKPTFELNSSIDKKEYVKGDLINVRFSGRNFSGTPLANTPITLSVFTKDFYETEKAVYSSSFKLNNWGGMCGGGFGFEDEYYGSPVGDKKSVTLDPKGEFSFDLQTKDLPSLLSQEVTFLVEKTDENGNNIVSAQQAIVHQGEFNIFVRPGPTRVLTGEEFTTYFYTENLVGESIKEKKFTYQIVEDRWEGGNKKTEIIKKGEVNTDSQGVGKITESIASEEPKYLALEIGGNDSRGNLISTRRYINIINTDQKDYFGFGSSIQQLMLKINSESGNLTVGKKAKLEIESPKNLKVFVTFERGRVYKPQWLDLSEGKNVYEFEVEELMQPSITPTFSFFYNGEYYIEGLSLNVPAMNKLISVSVSSDKQNYAPGEAALISLETKDRSGNPVISNVGLGIVDKAIFALRKNATPPIHSSFYFYRRRSTNASSSLTWIATFGGGGGGGGGADINPANKDADTVFWDPDLITSEDGKLTVEVLVGTTETTWKVLVYASSNDSEFGQTEVEFNVSKN